VTIKTADAWRCSILPLALSWASGLALVLGHLKCSPCIRKMVWKRQFFYLLLQPQTYCGSCLFELVKWAILPFAWAILALVIKSRTLQPVSWALPENDTTVQNELCFLGWGCSRRPWGGGTLFLILQ
jgi:hypothetical protein